MTEPPPVTAAEYLAVLRVVREAIDIPSPATVGDGPRRAEVLEMRTMHAILMLRTVLDGGDPAWNVAYLRERLAEHPATGYRTWHEMVAERHAAEIAAAQDEAGIKVWTRKLSTGVSTYRWVLAGDVTAYLAEVDADPDREVLPDAAPAPEPHDFLSPAAAMRMGRQS